MNTLNERKKIDLLRPTIFKLLGKVKGNAVNCDSF
jgi:hypothetical protein